ncbi:Phosphotransferase enzyme family protein [Aspergillus sp. HF37]|nr:Phosphotransferase enzyme family protein [Aspergillus sp. HF37]
MNMNELVRLGNFPPKILPRTPFTTASAYYQRLAETEFMHLATQRNDAVDSDDDCRDKYVARTLFCNLAAEYRLRNHSPPW